MFVDFELWVAGCWQIAARMEALGPTDAGYLGKVALEYETAYATECFERGGSLALSCRYRPSFALWTEAPWPAFVFDVLPAGAARLSMLARLGMADNRLADWPLLQRAQFSPGNVRVRPEPAGTEADDHTGFTRGEVVERGPDFIDYAFERGAPIAGSSGAHGDAPKFLLCVDRQGRWHAEGALPEVRVESHWLVKFPRGRHPSDLLILAEEARYMELARRAGLQANGQLTHEDGCLFVPRFDRDGGEYLGLETLASLSGVSDYGVAQSMQRSAGALAEHCTHPDRDLCEFVARDAFNLAVGNTDNHLRNTSVLKHPDGTVSLSPLYDLAPMLLDRSGIRRSCRWAEHEQPGGPIDWAAVIREMESLGVPGEQLRRRLMDMAAFVAELSDHMAELGVHRPLIERLQPRQHALADQLRRGAQT